MPSALFDTEIADSIADHVSPSFEAWCVQWLRTTSASGATKFGTWWGNAANEYRKTKERSSEEIDAVGSRRNTVVVVAEAKWTANPLGPSIVGDLEKYKIPALRQEVKVSARPDVVLFSKSGYTPALRALAEREIHITLVDVTRELERLREP